MTYLYEAIKPTRLYIKKCSHCNLKYFGKTRKTDICSYSGSGKKWKRHLEKYKASSIHLWNSDWYNDTSISRFAIKFSRINKIVESDSWANLKEENGLDGGLDKNSEEAKIKIGKALKGRIFSEETKRKMGESQKGRIHSEESKRKMSESQRNKIVTDETREKMKHSHLNNPILTCPHCQKEGRGNTMKRWHFDKCKATRTRSSRSRAASAQE